MYKIFLLFAIIITSSCAFYGDGVPTITGSITGNVPVSVKVALFPANSQNTFVYDRTNDSYGADKDMIFKNENGDEAGEFSPVSGLIITPSGRDYSIDFPDDPETVKCLVAWEDLDGDDNLDLGTEPAYLPYKDIDGTDHVIHWFSYIEVAEEVTYLAIHSTLDRNEVDYDLNNYDPHDSFIYAIGDDEYNFNFR
jgi:hypothetical protein